MRPLSGRPDLEQPLPCRSLIHAEPAQPLGRGTMPLAGPRRIANLEAREEPATHGAFIGFGRALTRSRRPATQHRLDRTGDRIDRWPARPPRPLGRNAYHRGTDRLCGDERHHRSDGRNRPGPRRLRHRQSGHPAACGPGLSGRRRAARGRARRVAGLELGRPGRNGAEPRCRRRPAGPTPWPRLALRRPVRSRGGRVPDPGSGPARVAGRQGRTVGPGNRAAALSFRAGRPAVALVAPAPAPEPAPTGGMRSAGRDAGAVPAAAGRDPAREPAGRPRDVAAGMVAVDRAAGELRRNSIVIIDDDRGGMLAQAAETLRADDSPALPRLANGQLSLALTAHRASMLKLVGAGPGIVTLPIAEGVDAAAIRALIDPTCPAPDAVPTPTLRPEIGDARARAAVMLCKLAQLLPAALVAPLADRSPQAAARLAAEHDLLRVPARAIMDYPRHVAATLRPVSEARVPLLAAEAARVVGFRPADGSAEQFAIVVGDP